jgi:type I restriction-modification system DNA methylase subunit
MCKKLAHVYKIFAFFKKMTLHEAIKNVLQKSSKPLKPREIASTINKYSLYNRKDQKPVTQNQVWARIKQYKNIFQIADDGSIELTSEETIQKEEFFRWVRNTLIHFPDTNLDIIILCLIYILKVTSRPPQGYYLEFRFDWADLSNTNDPKEILADDKFYEFDEELPYEFRDQLLVAFRNAESKYLSFLIHELNRFYDFLVNLSDEELKGFYSNLIIQVASKGIKAYEYGTPLSVSKFIDKLTDVRAGQKIFDPFAGFCTLLTEVVSGVKGMNVFANDINKRIGAIGLLNLTLNIEGQITFSLKDAFDIHANEKFDLIISNPPLLSNDIKERLLMQYGSHIPTTPVE